MDDNVKDDVSVGLTDNVLRLGEGGDFYPKC